MLKRVLQISVLLLTLFGSLRLYYNKEVGKVIDNYNGVNIYFNNIPFTSKGDSFGADGYYYGKKYQGVEFVKRYYDHQFQHRFSTDIEKGKDFYDFNIKDGEINGGLELIQYSNPSVYSVKEGDILVFKPSLLKPNGGVAIVSKVGNNELELVQQNCWKKSRDIISLENRENKWYITDESVIGRLSKNN
ncbi:CHAP domain-containing protein [Fusobacterium sp.]|uniref:CHAP domain-containing protein n=1 Tax=Fusobacterium sp. TaxID=68766 RepID=UPI0025C3F671|nr:CHAP domain-containing protein [Fusobacterium sp.]